ncbi:MAG: TlpA family protein disulfide reductase [Saprospiraceae bacterium]|nr:TlpA family protein disulfide reductase [Saprospiraceae bacterium]
MPLKILSLLILGLCSCQLNSNVQKDEVVEVKQMPIAKNAKASRDTLRPPSRIIQDRSRPENSIRKEFPFDIPLEDPQQNVRTSDTIIPDNGKPTVLLFWLTTCYPCRIEMAAIKKKMPYWEEEADFNILAISTDWDRNFEKFSEMARESDWPWETYRDKDKEFRKVLPGGLNGLPQTFVFDKNGEIQYHSRKYRTGDEDKLFAAIKKAAQI